MANNKIILGDEVLIDLTEDTVTEDTLIEGTTAHNAQGEPITGRASGGASSWNTLTDKPFEDVGSDFSTDNDTLSLSDAIKYGYIPQLTELPNDSQYKVAQYMGDDGDYLKHGYIYEHFDDDTYNVYFAFDDAETSETYYVKTAGNTLKRDSRGKVQIYYYIKVGQTEMFRLLYDDETDFIMCMDSGDYLYSVSANDSTGSRPNLNLSRKGDHYSIDMYDKETGHRIWQQINVQPDTDVRLINTKISQLETSTKALETEVSNINSAVSGLNTTVSGMQTDILTMQDNITNIQDEIGDVAFLLSQL